MAIRKEERGVVTRRCPGSITRQGPFTPQVLREYPKAWLDPQGCYSVGSEAMRRWLVTTVPLPGTWLQANREREFRKGGNRRGSSSTPGYAPGIQG